MTKILYAAYFFPPMGGAGVQRSQKFVRYLPEQGILPEVLTSPLAGDLPWAPKDESLADEIPSVVPVHRVAAAGAAPVKPSRMQRRMRTLLGKTSEFSGWWRDALVAKGAAVFDGSQKAIVATMSPFETAEGAGILSQRLGIPWIADLRDPWALDEMQLYTSGLHRRMEESRMERLLSSASAIIMNTPGSEAALRERFPRLAKVALNITNGYDAEDFTAPLTPRTDGKFRIVHSGSLHSKAGLELRSNWLKRALGGAKSNVDILTRSHAILVEALELWAARRPEVRETVEFVCAGNASAEDKAITASSSMAGSLRFTGYVSHGESTGLLRTAELLFLPMHNLPPGVPSLIVPGKTYEYIAAGRPILAAVPDGDVRTILAGSGMASVCRPDDREAMARILEERYAAWREGKPGPAPNASYVASFERRALTARLADVVRRVTGTA
ncbi:hypothetical protein F183_A54820 (plasmid) [Bryobacterales bacterium F-183]|nr:hypothetical protein F183_A54820 [Bryobacterales bacterium F-183]